MHEIHRRTCICQGFELACHIVRHLSVVVVAHPCLEQIAQDVECIRACSFLVQEAKKTPGRNRAFIA